MVLAIKKGTGNPTQIRISRCKQEIGIVYTAVDYADFVCFFRIIIATMKFQYVISARVLTWYRELSLDGIQQSSKKMNG